MQALAPWIDALGWTLLQFVWQGFLIGAGYAAARALIPARASEARHALSLVALAALALSPLITLCLCWPALQAPAGDALDMSGTAVGGAAGVVAAGHFDSMTAVMPWLVACWVVGVCFCALRALHQWRRLDRIVRCWATPNQAIDAMLASIMTRFAFAHRVRALISEQVDTPMLVGWLKPVILLPAAVALGFPRQQVELILAHELGHLRRRDHWVNLVQTMVETVLFYHPVVHWVSREIRNERELCCDRLVLRTMRGEPRDYARTLAALEEWRSATPLAVAANGGELLDRVQRIVGVTTAPGVAIENRSVGRWLLVMAGVLMAWAAMRRIEQTVVVGELPRRIWANAAMVPATPLIQPLAPLRFARWQGPAAATVEVPQEPIRQNVTSMPISAPAPRIAEAMPEAAAPPPALDAAPVAAMPPQAAVKPHAEVVEAAPPAAKPVAIHTVAPEFPGYARLERVAVEASFAIASDGSVHDVRVSGRAGGDFKRAAERALRQWRFDPASLPADTSLRYSQTFVFAPPNAQAGDDGCVRQTGSMICRSGSEESLVRAAEQR